MGRNAVGLLAFVFILGCARSPHDDISGARKKAREACKGHGGYKVLEIQKKQVRCQDNTLLALDI